VKADPDGFLRTIPDLRPKFKPPTACRHIVEHPQTDLFRAPDSPATKFVRLGTKLAGLVHRVEEGSRHADRVGDILGRQTEYGDRAGALVRIHAVTRSGHAADFASQEVSHGINRVAVVSPDLDALDDASRTQSVEE